ncbi:MAG: thioredoxin domain-containing protein [Phycisphaerae bacterium]|nr:thioredoxin domain-containing protein [Phycisphaerae bacterium]
MTNRGTSVALLRVGLILLALAGCVISAVLVRLSVPSEAPTRIFGAEVCAPSNAVDCDYVISSRWSAVGPIPAATLGVAYFAVIAAWSAAVGLPNYRGRRWHALPLVVVAVGFCTSLFFMYVMVFRLPMWCTWCVAAHVVNAAILLLMLLAWPRRQKTGEQTIEAQTPYPSGTRVLAVVASSVVLLLLIVVAGVAYKAQVVAWQCQSRYLAVTNDIDYVEWRYRQAPWHELPTRSDDLALGPADAPFTIVAFSDFECSKCQAFFLSTPNLLDRFPEKLRAVFKQYPMASACNPYVPGGFHHFSCEAALAAAAAQAVGSPQQSIDYHKALYANMARLDERPYRALAASIGIEQAVFTRALEDGIGRDRLDEDIALGHKLGVEGTPTIFLNGRQLPTWKIVTAGVDGKMDVDKTIALWERLLGETARRSQNDEALGSRNGEGGTASRS